MSRNEMRQTLIDSTICVIAESGFDKATTKLIATKAQLNEAYIYRCFLDKEDLFTKVFDHLDDELATKITQFMSVMYAENLDFEIRCRLYFSAIWSFLLGDKEKCLAFVRYYYSPYFEKFSIENHKKRYEAIVEKFKGTFKDEADVWMILNHILNVMLDFAVKVHNGQMSGEDNYSEHVFRVIFRSIEQYFSKTE